jgi:hypothetical protein
MRTAVLTLNVTGCKKNGAAAVAVHEYLLKINEDGIHIFGMTV